MPEGAGAKGRLNYVELTVGDTAVSSAFYAEVFGWRFTQFGPSYAATAENGTNLGLQADGLSAPPLPVIEVSDLEAALQSVEAAG